MSIRKPPKPLKCGHKYRGSNGNCVLCARAYGKERTAKRKELMAQMRAVEDMLS